MKLSGLILSILLVLVSVLVHESTSLPQLSPKVEKISILDLFKEDPSLKKQLEERLNSKTKEAPAARGGRKASPRTTTVAPTTSSAVETEVAVTPSQRNARGRSRPQRLLSRQNNTPAAVTPKVPTDKLESDPQQETSEIEQTEEQSTTTTTRRPNALSRFKQLGGPKKQTNAKNSNTRGSAPTSGVTEAPKRRFGGNRLLRARPEGRTDTATTTAKPADQNARRGGGSRRFQSSRSTPTVQKTEEEPKPETPQRNRFRNARGPRTRASSTTTELPLEEETPEEASSGNAQKRFRNARFFPRARS